MIKGEIVTQMIDGLLKLPDSLKTQEVDYIDKKRRFDELLIQKKVIENDVARVVDNDVIEEDGKIKKKYKNQAERDAETRTRLRSHQEYREIDQILNKLKEDIDLQELQIKYLSRRLRSFEALAILNKDLGEKHE